MRPVVLERNGRFVSGVEEFRGWREPSAILSRGWSNRYVGGSVAIPTQCGLIARRRMTTDSSSTAWPNRYLWTGSPIDQLWSLYAQGHRWGATCACSEAEISGCAHPPGVPVMAHGQVVVCCFSASWLCCRRRRLEAFPQENLGRCH